MKPIQLYDTASGTYTYVLFDPDSREAVIIDPVDGQIERDLDVLRDYGLQGEWLDHLTADLLAPSAPRMILPWRFKRDRIHLVEAGWSAP